MKRVLKSFLIVSALAGVFLLLGKLVFDSSLFHEYLRTELVQSLQTATGGASVTIESVQLGLFPSRLVISRLVIGSRKEGCPPVLSIPTTTVRFTIWNLLGSVQLKEVSLQAPQIHVEVWADGSNNLPVPPPRANPTDLFNFVAQKLSIENGRAQLNEHSREFSIVAEGFTLSARSQTPNGDYQIVLNYRNAPLSLEKQIIYHGLSASAVLKRNEFSFQKLTLFTANSSLDGQGTIRGFADPHGDFTYEASLQTADVRLLAPQVRDLQGRIQLKGRLEFAAGQWSTLGTLSSSKLSMLKSRIDALGANYRLGNERLDLNDLKFAGFHGTGRGSFSVESPFQAVRRQFKADVTFSGIGVQDISPFLGIGRAPFAGRMEGFLKASWGDRGQRLKGEGLVTIIQSDKEAREHTFSGRILPISGRLQFSLSEWKSQFDQSHLSFGGTQVEFVGVIAPKDVSSLRFEARSSDLSELAFLVPGVRGKANVVGVVEGSRSIPKVRANFLIDGGSYQGFQVDEAQGSFEADKSTLNVKNAELVLGRSRIKTHGEVAWDQLPTLKLNDWNLMFELDQGDITDLSRMVGKAYPVSGLLSGKFKVHGRYPDFLIDGTARVREGRILDQALDEAQFSMSYGNSILSLSELSARIGPGHVRGSAEINTVEQTIHGWLQGGGIPLEKIQWVQFPNNPINGTLSEIALKSDGPYMKPALEGGFTLQDLMIAGEVVGNFKSELRTEGHVLRIQALSASPAVDLKVAGSIDLNDNLDSIVQVSFKNFGLSPYIKKLFPIVPEKLSSRAAGQVVLSGPLRHREKLVLNGRLQSLEIDFREAQLQASKPFDIDLRDERISIKDATFSGKGTVLGVDGLIDFSGRKRLDLALHGNVDLSLLNEFVKSMSSSGNGTVNATLRGTLRHPRIQGQAQIHNGQFSFSDMPNSFSQVDGMIFFDEDQVKIETMTGTSGGGTLQASGDVVFGASGLKLINLRCQAREVRIRYPEGMRNVIDADLSLRGSSGSQLLSGTVQIVSASFQKGYDPIAEFLRERQKHPSWAGAKKFGSDINLDLTITGDRNIKLDTALVKMTSRADLKVKGTAGNPLVTGSIEASGGELYFQGARYRINRGRVEFVNPVRIDPRVDLEAETDLRDYRIVLTINGTADKFRADLRSDPPLPTVDLFSLVSAGGASAGSLSGASYRPYATSGRQQEASVAGAASLLSEGLSMQMGSRVKRIFGLDRFRVDPFLVGNERDPSARVTFGQQITKDLSITYSTSVSSNEQQVILLEYNLSDKMSVIASRDAEGAFGLDVRFRKRLRQKNH